MFVNCILTLIFNTVNTFFIFFLIFKGGIIELTVLDRIFNLLAEKGLQQQDLTNYLGVSKQLTTDWKAGRSKSYFKYIDKIAQFLNVSVDYLTGTEAFDEAKAQNSTERRLLLLARRAADIPEAQREELINHFENTIDLYLKANGIERKD